MDSDGPAGQATSRTAGARSSWVRTAALAGGFVAVAVALGAYALISGPRRYADAGNSFPGAFASVAEPVGCLVAWLLGALCLGALILVVVMSRPEPDGLIDAAAFRIHLVAERVSAAWSVVAAAMVVVQAGHDVGVSPATLLSGGALFDAMAVSELSRAWVVVFVFTLPVAVTLRFSTRWLGHAVLL
ncbi:MAG: hypothetical protein QOF15_4588, partial [Mycobacterium sp.]|nr:hypothetical protein [Mycobacterium sp.]